MNISVIKRDGSKEAFDVNKISRVMRAAGLNNEQTDIVLSIINKWLLGSTIKQIPSVDIRDKLLKILPVIDKTSANLFAWYQKTKKK